MNYADVPYTPGFYAEASRRSQVTRVLVLALGIRLLAGWRLTDRNVANGLHNAVISVNWLAWAATWFILVAASDYQSMSDLALTFAILIMLSVVIRHGEAAATHVREKISPQPAPNNPNET